MQIKIPKKVQEKILDGIPSHHRGIARAYFNGANIEKIAEDLNFSVPQVKVVLTDVAGYVNEATTKTMAGKKRKQPINDVKKAFAELDKRDEPSKELTSLVPRALEIISSVLYSDKLNSRQIDTAFKLLSRTGFHEKREELGGNKSLTFVSYAPLPGDDPAKALKRAKEIEDASNPK